VITLDQKQKHVTGPAELGDMAALKKIAKGSIQSAADFLKSFSDKTYYHYSDRPDIKQFDPKARNSFEGTNRGATYFTSDPKYVDEFFNMKLNDRSLEEYIDSSQEYLKAMELPSSDISPTIYPVKIKTDKIFDFQNQDQVDDLKSALAKRMPDEVRDFSSPINFWLRQGSWRFFENEEISKILKEKGYRGYKTNEPGTVGLFYPDKGDVRSVHAKFDPEQAKSGNILASVPVGYGALNMIGEENGSSF
jgi:hypothetical protein